MARRSLYLGYAEGYAQGRAHLLNRMWTAAQAEGHQELAAQVERIAREEGVELGEPVPR